MPSGIGTVTLLYLSNSAVHDPAVEGAIRSIDYAEDCAALAQSLADFIHPGSEKVDSLFRSNIA